MNEMCVTAREASKLLGVSERMIRKYLHSGELTVHHRGKNRVTMIAVDEVYNLREKKRKRG